MQTIPLQQAIDQAKANPTSEFAKKLRQDIEAGKLDQAAQKQGIDLSKYGRTPKQNTLERIVSGIKERGANVEQAISGTDEYAGKSAVERGVGATKEAFSAISSTIYNALPEKARSALDTAAGEIGKGFNVITDKLSENPLIKEAALSGNTKVIEDALKVVGDLGLISGEIAGSEIGTSGITKASNLATKGSEAVATAVSDVASTVASSVPKTKSAFLKFVSPKIDDTVRTALKETPVEKFDDFIKVAEEASIDATKPSVYEKVASTMEDAAVQINNQVKSLNKQKNEILGKAKTGLSDFSKQTGDFILEINRTLKDSALAKSFIEKLKAVKTKIDADKTIDELQDILYRGNKDMTIPIGSKEDSILKGIIGKYNAKLKESLPSSYAKINDEIRSRLSTLDDLNKALGETVDGVAVRGAGLVKQFFSPAGTKAKQLFAFIKEKTGLDLANDAILAKYIGEAFGDPKIRSLLEGGIPTSKSGAITGAVDFALEKTGVMDALREAKKRGMLEKARSVIEE